MDHTDTLAKMYERINAHDIDGFSDLMADDFVEHRFEGIDVLEHQTGHHGVRRGRTQRERRR